MQTMIGKNRFKRVKMKTKLCIFDLDGTLFNTLPTITHYVNKTITAHNIAPITLEECREFVGAGARNLILRTLAHRGISDKDFAEKILSAYLPDYDNDPNYLTEIYSGVPELLSELKKRGIAIAVYSNKPDYATKRVVQDFFGDMFSAVLGARDGVPLKPSPVGVLELVATLGFTPDESIFIGDSEIDVQTAKNAGLSSVAVTYGFRDKECLLLAGAENLADHPLRVLDYINI